ARMSPSRKSTPSWLGIAASVLWPLAAASQATASQGTASQAAASQAAGPQLSGGHPKFAPPPGLGVFNDTCAACHATEARRIGDRLAPAVSTLQQLPPERIYDALVSGKMREQAASLSDAQKRDVAAFLAGRAMVDVAGTDIGSMSGRCASNPPMSDPSAAASWRGWGNGARNGRYQNAAAAGLTASQVPRLKVKWAFGLPEGASTYSQPTVASGRVFFASDNAAVYSVDAKTGCSYWSFHADTGVRSAPIVAPIKGHGAAKYAVYVASTRGAVFAIDAQNGKLLWKTQPGDPRDGITGSPAYYDGRLYVPFVGSETLAGSNPKYECCKTRGALVALDADSGKTVWKTETIAEKLQSRGKNDLGTPLWGPAGASVWNTPTIDTKRRLVYIGTGNGYTAPAASTTDSILALDLATGRIVWHHQEFTDDAFILGCQATNPAGGNCPAKLGSDWDFGGAAMILRTLPDGRDLVIGAGKGGVAVAVDPDKQGAVVWRTKLYADQPPTADGLVVFGGAADATNVYYPLQRPGGGLTALRIATGERAWTADVQADGRGQSAPATVIPGVIFTGGWDGVLRAVSTEGRVIWRFDTKRSFDTVNGVPARGGSLGATAPVLVDGLLLVGSGYIGTQNGTPGNVILALAVN
ncbi:MAG TPA: PQQ-binding-like beta-propeller repeat protein, partial [Steroidobacteraceae bacterium]|nr:PQQ-binding-like beta-propeller repeat protein [Steroidobacteraceae bacterium]